MMKYIESLQNAPLPIVLGNNLYLIGILLKLFAGIRKESSSLESGIMPPIFILLLRIQELDNKNDAGSIPKALDCELLDDLIDTISPGEHITVSGIFRISNSDEST